MKVFDEIKKSIYGPEYYRHVFMRPFWSSVRAFYINVIWIALAITVLVSLGLVPLVNSFVSTIGPRALGYYPDGLVLGIHDGKASSSVQEPYAFPLPQSFKNDMVGRNGIPADLQNLIVLDTKDQFDMNAFRNLKTYAVLNQDSVAFYGDGGKITVQPLGSAPDMTLTKSNLASFVGKAEKYLRFLPFLVVILLFLGLIIFMSGKLVSLFLVALGIWAIFKIKKIDAGYKKAYQVGLHAATAGLILDYLFFFLLPGVTIPFFFTIITLVIAWINLSGSVPALPVIGSSGSQPPAEPPRAA